MAGKDTESEVLTAIAAFEQILEAMPDDRASLEALSHAYEQLGDLARAKDYIVRLSDVCLSSGDISGNDDLLKRLQKYSDEDSTVKAFAEKLTEKLSASAAPAAAASVAEVAAGEAQPAPKKRIDTSSVRSNFNMADELSFAWNLMEAAQLTQEEYSGIVQDLTEMSANDNDSTVSVMHVLEAKGFKNLEKVLSYVATQSGAPIVSLASFDLQYDSVTMLPLEFVRQRGVLVYEMLGSDALVVVMNPFDKQLQKDVETLVGRHCHFYTCLPQEFDSAVDKTVDLIEAAEEE